MSDFDETEADRLWAAIAGLRDDVERLVGRVQRISTERSEAQGRVEEAEAEWGKARQEQIDRLLEERAKTGKGDELDGEDIAELGDAWLSG
jgi:peptidoglycan hydrolase CwlO-like protein